MKLSPLAVTSLVSSLMDSTGFTDYTFKKQPRWDVTPYRAKQHTGGGNAGGLIRSRNQRQRRLYLRRTGRKA